MLTLPKTATASNYKLLPGGMFYKERRMPVLGIGLHITAGLQDIGMVGLDESNEKTIQSTLNANKNGKEVSYNAIADTDDVILCVPDWYTAWHIYGYNSPTVGIEICKLDIDWSKMSKAWVEATLYNAARWCAAIVDKHDLPIALANKASVDSAKSRVQKFGFTYHQWLNPTTRSDPGAATFPWYTLRNMIKDELNSTAPTPAPVVKDSEVPRIVQVRDPKTKELLPPQYVTNGTQYYWLKDGKAKANALKVWGPSLNGTPVEVPNLDGLGVLVGDKPPA